MCEQCTPDSSWLNCSFGLVAAPWKAFIGNFPLDLVDASAGHGCVDSQ